MKKDRLEKWDNAKAVLIMLVVFGHITILFRDEIEICKSAFFFIYAFHMPAFIFLSGLLGKNQVRALRKDRLISLFIISYILNFLRFYTSYLYNRNLEFRFFDYSNVSWYLFALIAYYIIAHNMAAFPDEYVILTSIALAMIAGYDHTLGTMLSLSRIIIYFPFFYLGYIADEEKLRRMNENKAIMLISTVVIASFLYLCIFRLDTMYQWKPLLSGVNHYYKFGETINPAWGGAYRFIYYMVITVLIAAFLEIIPNCRIPLLTQLGRKTLSVYFWHLLVLEIIIRNTPFREFMKSKGGDAIWYMLVVAVALTVICASTVFSKPIDYLINPFCRKKNNNENTG